MEKITHELKHDEFFKFYFVFMITAAVIRTLASTIPALMTTPPAATTPVIALGFFVSFLGVVGFVLSIVAIVLVVKRGYAKFVLALPITYFALGIVGVVVGVIASILIMRDQFEALGPNPTNAQMQAMSEAFTANPPMIITVYVAISGVILVILGVIVMMKARQVEKK